MRFVSFVFLFIVAVFFAPHLPGLEAQAHDRSKAYPMVVKRTCAEFYRVNRYVHPTCRGYHKFCRSYYHRHGKTHHACPCPKRGCRVSGTGPKYYKDYKWFSDAHWQYGPDYH